MITKKVLSMLAGGLAIALGVGIYVANRPSQVSQAAPETLTVYTAGPKPLANKLIKGFEKKTGIKVSTFDGTTGKILSKLQAEQQNTKADVLVLASMTAGVTLQKENKLVSYRAKRAAQLNPQFQDSKRQLFNYSASAVGITYSTKLVKQAPTDWPDLTTARYRSGVTIPDPKTSGASLDFINAYALQFGDPYFKALQQNGAQIGGANKEVLDAVITGRKKAVLGGVDYMSIAAIKKGEQIGFVYPSSGTLINPRPAMILKSSRHQAAAKQFIDYLLSQPAQAQIKKSYLIPGTAKAFVNPLNQTTIKNYRIDWTKADQQLTENIKHFNQVFNK